MDGSDFVWGFSVMLLPIFPKVWMKCKSWTLGVFFSKMSDVSVFEIQRMLLHKPRYKRRSQYH